MLAREVLGLTASLASILRPLSSPALLGKDKGTGWVQGHGGSTQRAHGGGGGAAGRLEGAEVVCPQEVLGSLLHGSHVQAAAGAR